MKLTYRMTDEVKSINGIELHRIIALDGNKWASPGTVGGWIESCVNLSGVAWVADNACVYGDAKVYGNSLVEDDAQVYGNAHLHGSESEPVILSFDRIIHGGDWTETPYAQMCGDWTAQITSPNTFRIGCQDHSFERWKKSYRAILRYCQRIVPINEQIIVEAVTAYNRCCQKYGKSEYMGDLSHVLEAYKMRTQAASNLRSGLNAYSN